MAIRRSLSGTVLCGGLSGKYAYSRGARVIPEFNDDGYLPPGVHPATLEEIEERFGVESELRHVQVQSVRWLVGLAREAGVKRIALNGSFVTDAYEPNDVDCVLLIPQDFPIAPDVERRLRQGLPFLDITVVDQDGFTDLVERVFASDRYHVPKGMVEVVSWS